MAPSNAMENDKKRLRNQFTKDERTRLLAIMTEYGPLLDDKNISILSRKEIWEIIENKFNENGHSGRTSAQLKKYWQNYKYHSKRTKIIHKEVPKPLSPMTKQMVRMLAKVDPEAWAQYGVAMNAALTKKSPGSSETSPSLVTPLPSKIPKIPTPPLQRSSKSSAVDGGRSAGAGVKAGNSESNVVVSTTDVPAASSVTVSVICPEISSKARTIFWKRNMPPQENLGPILQSNYSNPSERVVDDLGPEVGNSDLSSQEADDLPNDAQSGKLIKARQSNYTNRVNIVGMLPGTRSERSDNVNKKSGRYNGQLPAIEDELVLPREKVATDNRSPISITSGVRARTNQSESIGNVIGVVKEIPAAHLPEDCDSMENPGSLSMTNGISERTKIPGSRSSILNPFSSAAGGPMMMAQKKDEEREKRTIEDTNDENRDIDYAEFDEMVLQEFAAAKERLRRTGTLGDVEGMMETFRKVRNDRNFEGDHPAELLQRSDEKREVDTMSHMMNLNEDSSTQDLLWLKLYLRLLRSYGLQTGGNRRPEILRKFEALISTMRLTNNRTEDIEESSDTDQGMEVDEDITSPENRSGKLRVRRVSSMAPAVGGDQTQREIKVETDIETDADPDVGQNQLNDNTDDNLVMKSMNHLVQAKLQYAKSELDHQLKLQKLEMEEKQLRVRIAEMTIQETRLRIQALVEERLRATELHELRIAQIGAEKVRSDAEHAARIDASCTATAEGQARINSIERDRERSENFYQIQLRCMSANNANGNCGVKCKKYQQ